MEWRACSRSGNCAAPDCLWCNVGGWPAIDVFLFVMLLRCGLSSSAASRLSSLAAVSFVYFASARRIFVYDGRFVIGLFALP